VREVLALLEKAQALLDDVEDSRSFEHILGRIASKIFLAHANIKYAEAKLRSIIAEREEPCEKS